MRRYERPVSAESTTLGKDPEIIEAHWIEPIPLELEYSENGDLKRLGDKSLSPSLS